MLNRASRSPPALRREVAGVCVSGGGGPGCLARQGLATPPPPEELSVHEACKCSRLSDPLGASTGAFHPALTEALTQGSAHALTLNWHLGAFQDSGSDCNAESCHPRWAGRLAGGTYPGPGCGAFSCLSK